jgi:hypothetical protein
VSGGWRSRQDASEALAEANRRAAKVGGDVIRLPAPLAPLPIEEVFKRTKRRYEYLGLEKRPGDAEVLRLVRSGRFIEAVEKMSKAIAENTPPAGYRRLDEDPNVWIKVEDGTVVGYWCHGKEYTPAEYAAEFNGGFDAAATIQTSAPRDIHKGDLYQTVLKEQPKLHTGFRVVEDHNLDLSLYDAFSVNGGGFDI